MKTFRYRENLFSYCRPLIASVELMRHNSRVGLL